MNKRLRRTLRVRKHDSRHYRPLLELLERRIVFASDFGDAPLPYRTLVVEGGAEHVAIGPMLGTSRDTEFDGSHDRRAAGDDLSGSADDEDGVLVGTMRAGQLDVTALVIVNGGTAKLDAWIDFNRDGAWGSAGEQIADSISVEPGDNSIFFDVPSWASDGSTFARFRLSTDGDLGMGGLAIDGEVEDHILAVKPAAGACGCFTEHEILGDAASASSVYAADVDGDGDVDLLTASANDDRVAWYENKDLVTFQQHTISTAVDGVSSVFAVDMDGDGDIDVLSASSKNGKVDWYENDGAQNFHAQRIAAGGGGPDQEVIAADIDDDGDMDVVSGYSWYENDGTERFGAHFVSAAWGYIVDAADLDSDGDIDFLSSESTFTDGKLYWYENDGTQEFTAHKIYAGVSGVTSALTADIDGDADLDILSSSAFSVYSEAFSWWANDGDGNFTLSGGGSGRVKSVADLDGDGDTDVLTSSSCFYCAKNIAWHENDGNQNFSLHTIANTPGDLYVADVDGDADLDVLASAGPGKLAWHENLPNPFPSPPAPGREFSNATGGLVSTVRVVSPMRTEAESNQMATWNMLVNMAKVASFNGEADGSPNRSIARAEFKKALEIASLQDVCSLDL